MAASSSVALISLVVVLVAIIVVMTGIVVCSIWMIPLRVSTVIRTATGQLCTRMNRELRVWDIRLIIVAITIVIRVVIAVDAVILVVGIGMRMVAVAVAVIIVVTGVARHDDKLSLSSEQLLMELV